MSTQPEKTTREIIEELGSTEKGLTEKEAENKRQKYGNNQLEFHKKKSPWIMLLEEFKEFFPLLLMAAALLAFFANYQSPGEGYDYIGIALVGVVLLNATVSFIQRYQVEKMMQSFLDYIPREVAVIRDRQQKIINAKNIVPGDLLIIQEGDKIPADSIVIETDGLMVDESILTGESEPIGKQKKQKIYSGTTVLKGTAKAVVEKTGKQTRIGSISEMSQEVEKDLTPMQKELKIFVKKITYLALSIGFVFFIVGFIIGNTLWTNLIFAIGIIVANVPEGLLPTVTMALSQASAKMGRHNAVVKNTLSVETLGSTNVICTDKTGTLTQNKLHVDRLYTQFQETKAEEISQARKKDSIQQIEEIMALCNEIVTAKNEQSDMIFKGDPTEIAMAEYSEKLADYQEIRDNFVHVSGKPFSSQDKYMYANLDIKGKDKYYLVAKGATEVILDRCNHVHGKKEKHPITEEQKKIIQEKSKEYAAKGMRVLAMAYKNTQDPEDQADNLIFAGLVAMIDPPREEVYEAIEACKTAGIKIIVISGDKAETVEHIAKNLGIVENPRVIEGSELEQMSMRELKKELKHKEILFARTAPAQKLKIVRAIKETEQVVAVTGDGVNDAPALKKADIGVSMGESGTDVAKEASDIILLDDNFANIVKAVKEGRTVYDNIKKFITYILTSNIPEILPFIAYVLFPIPLPITVIQILSIDLITDILPAIGLGNEKPEKDIMERPPRSKDERLVSKKTFLRSYGIIGPAEALMSFIAFFAILFAGGWMWGQELAVQSELYRQAAAAFLAAIIFSQIGNVNACRTNRQSAIPHLKEYNSYMAVGWVVEILFIVGIIYLPIAAIHGFFTTAPIPLWIWPVIIVAPFVIFLVEETRKYLVRQGMEILAV